MSQSQTTTPTASLTAQLQNIQLDWDPQILTQEIMKRAAPGLLSMPDPKTWDPLPPEKRKPLIEQYKKDLKAFKEALQKVSDAWKKKFATSQQTLMNQTELLLHEAEESALHFEEELEKAANSKDTSDD